MWYPDGNFDRISSMGMCLILDKDYERYAITKKDDDKSTDLIKSAADYYNSLMGNPKKTNTHDFGYKQTPSLNAIKITNNHLIVA